MRYTRTTALVGLAVASLACGSGQKTAEASSAEGGMHMAEDSAAGDQLPMKITLSAAQVQHGGIAWSAISPTAGTAEAAIPGEIMPNEDRTARLGAPARGRVIRVFVQPGDAVRAGQALVTMQSPDAGLAQSDVAKGTAELTARRAEAQYAASARARAERLLAMKAIPRQDYDRAVTDDEHARAALAEAEAESSRATATAVHLSADTGATGEIVLRSPTAGVVLERAAVPGVVVDAGAPLIVVTSPSALWLRIDAPESMAGLFRKGDVLRFVTSAFPHDTSRSRVITVGAGLEPETRTLTVRAEVSGDARLKPRMLASVLVPVPTAKGQFFVPDDAVQRLRDSTFVFVARPAKEGSVEVERREVMLGGRANGRALVLKGVQLGDVIVTTGAFAVKAAFEKSIMKKMEM